MNDTVSRFSNRVENYVKYRPGYPAAMMEFFQSELGVGPASVVADIGSGTGLSSRPFVELGCRVYGIEPNAAMRDAAEEFLKGFQNFVSVDGTSENTTLPDDSVDIALAAQAFHWFDPEPTGREFKRILRPGGYAALIWNERQLDTTAFLRDYEQLLLKYGRDYAKVRHENVSEEMLSGFFNAGFERVSFPNEQVFDLAGIRGRLLSSSYMPDETDPVYDAMIDELALLFAKHAENDRIKVFYDTNIFYSRL